MMYDDAPFLTWLAGSRMFRAAVASEATELKIPDMSDMTGSMTRIAVMKHNYKFNSGLRFEAPVSLGSRFDEHRALSVADLGAILEGLIREEQRIPLMLACNDYSAGRIDTERPGNRALLTHMVMRALGRLLLGHGYEGLLSQSLEETQEQATI